MKKFLVILSFVIISLFFLFSEVEKQGTEESKKKVHELKYQSKTIDPIKEMTWDRKYRKKVSTSRLYSSANPTNNNNHSLTEVGVWGYGPCDNVYVDGNRAYMGSGRYLLVMDISDKTKPVKIGEIMLNNHIHWLSVSGSYAYIANDTSGLRIIDVSDINNIQEVGYYDTPGCSRGIFVSGTHAYMADQESGLRIIDISTPSSPQEVGFYDTPGGSFSVFVSGGYAYVGDMDSGLRIIDVTNPVSPKEVGFYKTPSNSLGVFVSGNYAYVACGLGGSGVRIFDVSNRSSPQEVGFYDLPSGSGEEVYILGNYAYYSTTEGLRVLDISNPGFPYEVGYCATPGDGVGIYASGNYAYVADWHEGLRVVDITTPSAPNEIGSYDTPGSVVNLHVSENYAYLATYEEGLIILDTTNPNSLEEVGSYDTPGKARGIYVTGNYAYIADLDSGLRVINVSNPVSPQEVGFYDTPGWACGVYVSGNYAYVADYGSGLRVIDITNPNFPNEVGNYDTPDLWVFNVYVSGNFAYVAAGRAGGLKVLDVSDPSSPKEVGSYDTPGSARNVFVSNGYIFVADQEEGLRVIDLPEEIGYFNTPGNALGVNVSGHYAYVADEIGGLRVLDVSIPSSIQEVATFEKTLTSALNVHVSGGYIFVANNWCGMTIFKHETSPPGIYLDRDQLNFGYEIGGNLPGSQNLSISNSGGGTLNWTVSDNAAWLNCSPTSGTSSGGITVSIDPTGLSSGTYTGSISVEATNASNSPQTVDVTLELYSSGSTSSPFGTFETPVHGSNVQSSVPFTGWVLDDIGVESVKIYRANGKNLVYIGDGMFVEGARPDIEQAFPGYPYNYKAGWGYMMLTNFLPDGGNGTYIFHVIATDVEGHQVTLGTKTVTIDNANAVKPFGAIDTPAQGGSASGSNFRNLGWVLTPTPNSIPTDGSTIKVIVDGVNLGHPTYNIYRSDIATLFPGYANSDGALAYFDFDTTTYSNGVHTIAWTAADDVGNADGIGSRYFSIQNSVAKSQWSVKSSGDSGQWSGVSEKQNLSKIRIDNSSPVWVLKGYEKDKEPQQIYPDDKGIIMIEIKELEPIEINLVDNNLTLNTQNSKLKNAPYKHCTGYLRVGNKFKPLPIGSTLDSENGIFSWIPLHGFVGNFEFVFIKNRKGGEMTLKNIIVRILPKFFKSKDD